ncbi:hypothetical protein EV201_2710 [Ancylomarina subtilis]|uniref:ABC-2 type transport system permease protein n=1 Tax=Ancylomarina subtilis TaxID=1639035 RepID=A0A4Q7VCY5_9BACT|nr:hypothetical protein [Ancylomarina subtilis]RZT93540.1 hypothetical protein EV201_2710 [Ancylomarina subtilis]
MVNFIIRIVRLFRGLFRLMGVDYKQLESILWVKLTMGNRRGFSTSAKKKDSSNQLLLQTFVYAVLGIFVGTLINSVNHTFTAYVYVFLVIMSMIALMMISEFSVVLIDTRDNAILLPRPINNRTLTVAKILHIAIYLLQLSLSLSIASAVFTVFNYGFAVALLFLFLIFLSTLFTLFLTCLFYLGLMRLVSGEKLKDILVYFQIGMAIIFMGAYQLLPRLIEMNDLYNAQMAVEWWTYLIPPAWFAGSIASFTTSVFGPGNILFLALALFAPILGLWLIVKYLSPKFNYRLSQMEATSSKPEKRTIQKGESVKFVDKLGELLTRNIAEKTAFKMIWKMSGRDRKYKQTVFPAFGYVFVMIAVTVLGKHGEAKWDNLIETKLYLAFLYLNVIAAFSACINIIYSDEPKSSWFYKALPVARPGDIIAGSIKAILSKYFMPLHLLIGSLIVYFWSYKILPDIFYSLISIIVISVFITASQSKALPFSKEKLSQDSGSTFIKGILIMLSAGLLGAIHWGLTFIDYGVLFALPFMLGLQYLSFRYIKKIQWNQIED